MNSEPDTKCSGLMPPDTSLGETSRHDEVSNEATSIVLSRVQSQRRVPGS
jgi:hypothetical protein